MILLTCTLRKIGNSMQNPEILTDKEKKAIETFSSKVK